MLESRKSKRAQFREMRREKDKVRLTRILSPGGCTFPSGFSKYLRKNERNLDPDNVFCCNSFCLSRFSVHYVMLIRYHFSRLPLGDRNIFIRACAWKEGDKERYVYELPNEEEFKDILMSAYPGCVADADVAVPPYDSIHRNLSIVDINKSRVCKRAFLWILLEASAKLLYLNKERKRHIGQMRFDEGFGNNCATRRVQESRCKHLIRRWLGEAKKSHLCRPDADVTVLPWKSKVLTHAAFASETEKFLMCDWVGDNGFDEYDIGEPDDNEARAEIVEGQNRIEDPERASGNRTAQYRYGNQWLGKKGSRAEHEDIATYSTFLTLWRAEYKNVKVRKWLPFSKCDMCWDLRTKADTTSDPEARAQITVEYKAHLDEVQMDRDIYRRNKERARLEPTKYLSLTVDAADNADHALPYVHDRTKVSSDMFKHRMHLIGVIAHGHGAWAFTCPSHVAQGHNITIQSIVEVLVDLRKRYRDQGVCWPKTLYLQLDNTTKQNKGKFLCAFLHILVDFSLLDHIYCNFLPVGHTHIDIDQFFGRYSVYLRSHNCLSRSHMKKGLEECYRQRKGAAERPVVRHWDTVANISEWLKEQECASTPNIMAFRSIRIFKSQSEPGAVWMQVRKAPRKNLNKSLEHLTWGGLLEHTTHHKMFDAGNTPDILAAVETSSIPLASQPTTLPSQETLNKIAAGLRKFELHFSRIFTDEHREDCWAIYNLMVKAAAGHRDECKWDFHTIKCLFPGSPTNDNPYPAAIQPPVAAATLQQLNSGEQQWAQWNPTENKFYVVRPPEDDPAPFYIARCIQIDRALQEGEMEESDGAWVQFWAPKKWVAAVKNPEEQTRIANTLDYLTEAYVAEIPLPRILPGKLTFLDKKCFQYETAMTGAANSTSKTISNSGNNRNRIKGWAERWKGGEDMSSSDSDSDRPLC